MCPIEKGTARSTQTEPRLSTTNYRRPSRARRMCWEAEFGVTSQYGDTKAGSGNFEYGRACCLCRECPQLVEADIRPLNGNSGFAIGRSRCARSSPQCR